MAAESSVGESEAVGPLCGFSPGTAPAGATDFEYGEPWLTGVSVDTSRYDDLPEADGRSLKGGQAPWVSHVTKNRVKAKTSGMKRPAIRRKFTMDLR